MRLCYFERTIQAQVGGRRTYPEVDAARFDEPLPARAKECELLGREAERDALARARGQFDAFETAQLEHGPRDARVRVARIELDDFIARDAAPLPVRRVMHGFSRLVVAAVGALLAWWGAVLTADSWEVPMAGARIPEGTFYLPLCLGGVLIAVFSLHHLFAGKITAERGE